jgi:hypothetical protein
MKAGMTMIRLQAGTIKKCLRALVGAACFLAGQPSSFDITTK